MSIPHAAAAATAGPMPPAEDLGPLAWVLPEIQRSLDAAIKALRRFAREGGAEADTGSLRVARQQLHQAVGVLQMVGQQGPGLVLGAMEFAAQGFVLEPARCTDDSVHKVERASFAVSDYLNAMLAGKSVSAVALFPQYREVLELAGNERVHPADLWPYAWCWAEVPRPHGRQALVIDPAVRARLDREVLRIVKSGDDAAALQLRELCAGLACGTTLPRHASFWALAAGFFEALGLGLIPADVYAKRAASRVLLQYATLARGDTAVSDRLGQDLLFFCSQAQPGVHDTAPLLRAVRTAWGVADHQGVDYSAEQFGRFDPAALVLARKRIETAKEAWSALSGGDLSRVRQVADGFAQLGDSLQKLHPPSLPLVQALNHAVDASMRSGQPPATELGMEVATSVLYLEAAFADLDPQDRQLTARTVQLAGRIERARESGRSEPLEPWMEELYRRVSDRQTLGTVVDELRAHLSELEKSLDQFFRRPADKELLRGVPAQLMQMRGVFSVLGLDQAARTVLRMRDSVEHLLVGEAPADEASDFDSLGNNLGALGFLIDMLGYQPALAKRVFVFDEEAGELKPVMGRQAAGAQDPAELAEDTAQAARGESVLRVEDVDAQIAARLAELAAQANAGSPQPAPATPIEEFSQAAASWKHKITGPAAAEPLPDTLVTELEEDDLQNIFLDEAREVLQSGLGAVATLERAPDDVSELTVLRRAFHTLKGSSRMVGLTDFGEAAWSFEQVLNTWLADQRAATPALVAGTRRALNEFGQWVEAIAAGTPHAWQSAPMCSRAEALLAGQDAAEASEEAAPVVDSAMLAVAARQIAAEPTPLPALPALPDLELASGLSATLPPAANDAPAARVAHDDFPPTDFLDFEPAAEPSQDADSAAPAGLVPADFFALAEPNAPAAEAPAAPALDFALALEPEESAPAAAQPAAQPEPAAAPIEAAPVAPVLQMPTQERDEAPAAAAAAAAAALPEVPAHADVDAQDEAAELSVEHQAAFAAEAVAPTGAVAPEEDTEPASPILDETIKVIGPLRIGVTLYNVYLNEADEWSRQLVTEIGEWALQPHTRVAESTLALTHSLAGSSATVGFQSLSAMARLIEGALQHLQMQGSGTAEQGAALVTAADEVRRLLHQFAAGFLREPAPAVLQALRDIALAPPAAAEAPAAVAPALALAPAAVIEGVDDAEDAIDVADAVDLDLFPIFEEEAAELLPQLGAALRAWSQHPEDTGPRAIVLRTLHTLKGSARLAGAMRLGERAHRMESAVEAIGTQAVERASVEHLLARFDTLQLSFDALRAVDSAAQAERVQRATAPAPVAAPVAMPEPGEAPAADAPAAEAVAAQPGQVALAAPAALSPLRSGSGQTVRIRTQLLDRLVGQAGEVIITRSRLEAELGQLRGALSDLTGNLDRLRQQLRDIEVQAESQMQSRLAQAKDSAQGFDPLEFDRFTRVQELTRMMAESVNDVATVQRTLQKTVQATEDDLSAQARQTRELQRGLLRTRMVEFESLSERLYRVVRQASKDTGKQVRLDITGGSIEIDRGVLDRMTPAFEHLLRNCVAHGIEDAAQREQAGKEATGLIVIDLRHEGNDVSVSFRDDGRGLDIERITARARALELLADDQELSGEEAADLIFRPGFSTAAQVSELAGRGIGMDVVRAQVAALGGRIETHSSAGQGTQFKLVLPLTTAVTHVVMLRAGETIVGVPSGLVELVQRASAAELEQAYRSGSHAFGNEQVPFFWAGALLQASARSERQHGRTNSVVIVRSAAQRIALHVDEVLGNQEVVVKNLGPQLVRVPGMAGISLLASGAVALIYNPGALAALHGDQARVLQERGLAAPAAEATATPAEPVPAAPLVPQVPLVLVVDDSITVRRVTQRLLQREGYRVALAADGLQALERLQQERPAVVLSDIEMPRMDGFDLARNIRADASFEGLPIIMITSRIAEKHREHALALGINHYLGKPYSEEELLRLVRSYTAAETAALAAA